MSTQIIGKVSLQNDGLFFARIQFQYTDANGETQYSKESRNILPTRCWFTSPGELGVPDGVKVKMVVDFAARKDLIAEEEFIYEEETGMCADYRLTGGVFRKNLELTRVAIPEWKNWSQNIVYNAPDKTYFYPTNRAELQTVLAEAKAARESGSPVIVRVSGQRHSQPPLVIEDNREGETLNPITWLVDMSCYKDLGQNGDQDIILVDNNTRVQVNTGVREDNLDSFLASNNKILRTVTAGGFFSIGGMTSNDVHGATVDAPIFSETAVSYDIMGPDGEVTTITRTSEGANGFNAYQFACVNVGALGIVTSVTLEILGRPYANTLGPNKEKITLKTEEDFVAKFRQVTQTYDRVETFFNPYSYRFMALEWNLVDNPEDPVPNQPIDYESACELAGNQEYGAPYEGVGEKVEESVARGIQYSKLDPIAEGLVDTEFGVIQRLFNKAVDNYSDLWLTKAARTIFMSYFVELPALDDAGLGKAWEGLNFIGEYLKKNDSFLLAAPIEFRFVKGGGSVLAGTYSTNPDSYFINYDMIGFTEATVGAAYPDKLKQFFANIERKFVEMGGLPHNGKMYGFYDPTNAEVSFSDPFNDGYMKWLAEQRQDRIAAFEAYRAQRDPEGLFSNEWTRKLLGTF